METHAPTKLVPSFYSLAQRTIELIKKTWLNLLMSLCVMALVIFITSFILYLLYYSVISFGFIYNSLSNFVFFQICWAVLVFIIFYLIAVFAQVIIIKSLLDNNNFQQILKSLPKYFLNYLCLSIIISLLLVIAGLPIYSALILFYLQNWVLGFLSLLLAYILIIVFSVLVVFSPLMLIEQNLYPLTALKNAYLLSKKFLIQIIWKIFLLSVILLILDILATLFYGMPFIGLLIWFIISLIISILFFAFPITLYKSLKS
jgi:hypothetical protein